MSHSPYLIGMASSAAFLALPRAEAAAAAIVKGMRRREHEIHFPKRFTLALQALNSLPSRLRNRLLQATVRNHG
jgi:hypothetical protein